MRKVFIVILLVIAANAYSQARANQARTNQTKTSPIKLGAQVFGGFNLIDGNTNKHRDIEFFGLNSGKVKIQAQAEVENFGGFLRLGYDFKEDYIFDFDLWWKHSEKFAFYITYNEDEHLALDNIAGENFYGFPGEVLDLRGWAVSTAFYEGFSYGAFISVHPVNAFGINWGLNLFKPDIPEFMLKSMTLQFIFDFKSAGKLGLTVEGDYMTEASLDDNPNIFLYYNKGIKEIDIDIGLSYKIWDNRKLGDIKTTRHHPVNLGIGVAFPYNKGNFKTRLSLSFLGKDIVKTPDITIENKHPFDIGIDVLPSYIFKDNITGYLNVGLGFSNPELGEQDFFWRVNPYVVLGNISTASFYASLDLFNTAIDPKELHFRIAAGLSINF